MTKSLEEANAGIRALEDEIIIIRDSPLSDKDIQARVNKVQDKLKILLRRRIEDLYPNFCIDIADIDERIRIGISLSNHYARLNELIPENALEATSLADRFHEVNDELRELRKRKRGRISGGSINGLLQFDVFRSGMFGVAWCHMINPDFSYSNITSKLRCEGLIPNLILEDGQKMITLSKEFLENSGVGLFHVADEEKTYCRTSLFLRSYCMDQIACIRDRILDKGSVGFIHGPPGTGKSIITYFFMALMSRKNGWRVVWVHFRKEANSLSPYMDCVIFSEGNKYSFEANAESLRKLFSEMSRITNQRVTIVLDGFKRIDEINNIYAAARTWLQSNKENGRIICISSLGSSNRWTAHDDRAQKLHLFEQFSWTWDEYVEAINCPEFYEEVAPMLDAPSVNQTPLGRLAAKFFYAGACARYMFAYSTASVKNSILKSLLSTNLSTFIKDSGTSDAVNRLFKYFPESSGTLLSEFVHHTLTDMNAPEDIIPLFSTGLAGTNAALRGILFEALFFSYASRFPEITLRDITGKPVGFEANSRVNRFDPTQPTIEDCKPNVWLRPICPRNPGFDGLYLFTRNEEVEVSLGEVTNEQTPGLDGVSEEGQVGEAKWSVSGEVITNDCVSSRTQGDGSHHPEVDMNRHPKQINVARFVQTTIAESHDLKLQYFADCAKVLNSEGIYSVDEVEIFFIVPDYRIRDFRIGTIDVPTALLGFKWPRNENKIKEKITVLGLKTKEME
jgi:hypothetical protein